MTFNPADASWSEKVIQTDDALDGVTEQSEQTALMVAVKQFGRLPDVRHEDDVYHPGRDQTQFGGALEAQRCGGVDVGEIAERFV